MTSVRLSKSRILAGIQCPRRLWLLQHRPDLSTVSPAQLHRLQVGTEFGEIARGLVGEGTLVGHVGDLRTALAESRQLVSSAGPGALVFEAAIDHGGVLVRADVLELEPDGWALTEVKSSTKVKEHYLIDIAVQAWVMRGAGIAPTSLRLGLVNSAFTYQGDDRYDGLLAVADVTAQAQSLLKKVPRWIEQLRSALAGPEPEVVTGKQCADPFSCQFLDYCQGQEPNPPAYPISILYRATKRIEALSADGFEDLSKVPLERLANPMDRRIALASRDGQPYIADDLKATLRAIPFPRRYLDFETIMFVVPIWAETRPHQQLPFQWSCHMETVSGELSHADFLDTSGEAPMRTFAHRLVEACGDEGPILVYNAGFERGVVKNLMLWAPEVADALRKIAERMLDLLPIMRQRYYHPAMMGSWSIKSVLPTIVPELDYSNVGEVQGGTAAQSAYLEAIHPATMPDRRESIRSALLAYCSRDTEAMLRLVQVLSESMPQGQPAISWAERDGVEVAGTEVVQVPARSDT